MTIVVQERGTTQLTHGQWSAVASSEDFWRLVHGNVLKVVALSGGRVRLDGTSLVGRARCGGIVVECREKIPGALLSLLSATTPTFKTRQSPAPATGLGELVPLLVRRFVSEVRRYVGNGREWRYASARAVSSLVAGRLHVPSTAHLHARGLRHLASFDRSIITRSTPANRLIYAALREVEVLAELVDIPWADIADARAMAIFFEDCRDAATIFGASVRLADEVRDLLDSQTIPPRVRDPLSLAGVLLAHNSFEIGSFFPEDVPFAWFLNLETLFERAIREQLSSVTAAKISVRKGPRGQKHVFPDVGKLGANPDLVLESVDDIWVGDVKYKDWSGSGEASDLYQLIAHSATYGASEAFLVYPSDSYAVIDLGNSATGVRTRMFSIDVRDLRGGLERLCKELELEVGS